MMDDEYMYYYKFEAHFDLDFGGIARIIISYIPMQTDP